MWPFCVDLYVTTIPIVTNGYRFQGPTGSHCFQNNNWLRANIETRAEQRPVQVDERILIFPEWTLFGTLLDFQ